jgi:hypothetical protein
MPLRYPYPENGWSTGRMRKRGEKPEGETELAMDLTRRGRPELGGPGVAEAEKLAGAFARGRGGLSPDTIAQQKAAIQGLGQQWNMGAIDWRTFHKEIVDKGWSLKTVSANLPGAERAAEVRKRYYELSRS